MTMPGTKSSRVAYPPPVPAALPDPGGKTPVERAYRTQQAVRDSYSRRRAAHSRDIDMNVLKRNAGAFADSPVAKQLPPVLASVKDDAVAAADKVQDLINGTKVATEQEGRASRVWNRALNTLNSKRSPGEIIAAAKDLIAHAGEDLPIYVEEVKPYLEAKKLPTDWLERAYAQGQGIPGLAEAASDARVKIRQHAMLRHNDAQLRRSMERDVAPPTLFDPSTATDAPYTDSSGD